MFSVERKHILNPEIVQYEEINGGSSDMNPIVIHCFQAKWFSMYLLKEENLFISQKLQYAFTHPLDNSPS